MTSTSNPGEAVRIADRTKQRQFTSQLLKTLKSGCVCAVENEKFAAYIATSVSCFQDPDSSSTKANILAFLTFLKSVLKVCLVDTSCEEASTTVCKRLQAWLLLLRKIKVQLLQALMSLINNHESRHVRHTAEDLFGLLLALLPCPMIVPSTEECCKTICQPISQHFAALKSADRLGHSSNLVLTTLCHLDNRLSKSSAKRVSPECITSRVVTKPSGHYKHYRTILMSELRSNWKTWVNQALNSDSDDDVFKVKTLTLWRSMVDIKSNVSLHLSREFVSTSTYLVECLLQDDHEETSDEAILQRKRLDILCEVFCYGSTLGIQSDIPSEVSEVAHKLLRQSRRQEFSAYAIPNVYTGMAGNHVVVTDENEELEPVPDLVILQRLSLIHLKAVALLVREAQCCSSSDESDSSVSSRGSGSVAEEEQEMRLIEKNVHEQFIKMRAWINETLGLHSSSSLISGIVTVFNDQDDGLIEALLCLLDTYTGIQFGSYTARLGISAGEEEDCLDLFNPMEGFDCFLQALANDSSMILDFLLSNETCFLLYFLRFLKYLAKNTSSSRSHPARERILPTLFKVRTSIQKLTNKQLFPYDIAPVLKLLDKLHVAK